MKVLLLESDEWLDKEKRKARMKAALPLLSDKLKKKHAGLEDLDLHKTPSTRGIHLTFLKVGRSQRQKGVGSAVLKDLGKFADRHKSTIELQLADKNKEHGTTSSSRLRKFYGKHKFVSNRGSKKRFDISAYTDMYRKPKTEGILRSGYKVKYHTTTEWTNSQKEPSHVYDFSQHRKKTGQVVIHHHIPSNSSHVEFYSQSNLRPDHKDAHAILKTVEKAVRHHIKKVKPELITYIASSDAKDKGRYQHGNRRGRLYDRMAKRILSKSSKASRDSYTDTKATFAIKH